MLCRSLGGNEFANYLIGRTDADTLNGGAGNDRLDGRAGADTMSGGAGNDIFYVDNTDDTLPHPSPRKPGAKRRRQVLPDSDDDD